MFPLDINGPEYMFNLWALKDDRPAFFVELYHVVGAASSEVCSLSSGLWARREVLSGLLFNFYMALHDVHTGRRMDDDWREYGFRFGFAEGDEYPEELALSFLRMVFEHLPSDVDWSSAKKALWSSLPQAVYTAVASALFEGRSSLYCLDYQSMMDFFLGYWEAEVPQAEAWSCFAGDCRAVGLPGAALAQCTPFLVAKKLAERAEEDLLDWDISCWAEAIATGPKPYAHFLLNVARDLLRSSKVICSEELRELLEEDARKMAAKVLHLPFRLAHNDMAKVVLSFLF